MTDQQFAPLHQEKDTNQPSIFRPDALIREARRQKGLSRAAVPAYCVLDPDGDIVRYLDKNDSLKCSDTWPCYHSKLYTFIRHGHEIGIVGCVVGAPYAVLVAEQMFAIGCKMLISITSAGQIIAAGPPPYFVVIDRALRDEGTSYHYCTPAEYAEADPRLIASAISALGRTSAPVYKGSTWTTDAPFRETAQAIAAARRRGVLAVEMEAAALYAFAAAQARQVLCLAHVTNQMGLSGDDFEKGESNGALDALNVIAAIIAAHDLA